MTRTYHVGLRPTETKEGVSLRGALNLPFRPEKLFLTGPLASLSLVGMKFGEKVFDKKALSSIFVPYPVPAYIFDVDSAYPFLFPYDMMPTIQPGQPIEVDLKWNGSNRSASGYVLLGAMVGQATVPE